MKAKSFSLFLLMTIISAISCDKSQCNNTNETFNKFPPDSKEYTSELARQISSIGPENLSYWFDKYLKKEGKEFIVVQINGDKLCAEAQLEVKDWSKISGMRREISGYHGAQLKGLTIDIHQDSTGTNLMYKDVYEVID